MPAAAAPAETTAYAPPLRTSVERLRGALLWLTGLSGAFVFMEPSPYEVASLLTLIVFAVTGLSVRSAIMPLVLLLLLYNIGFSIAVVPVLAQQQTLTWVLISWYMAATAIFFAAMLGQNTGHRLALLLRGYTAAAVIASIAAVGGYFHLLPLSDLFLKFGRAQGTFNDPNVLGAFLIFPALLALQRVLAGRPGEVIRGGALLMLFVLALLLSFSRGAWGQFALCAVLVMALTFIVSRSGKERLRIIVVALAGVLCLALFVGALLSIEQVAELFQERATLDQSHDTGHTGRFGRWILGLHLALEQPFGIGPLQFSQRFPEDPHNSYLNAFMSGGWLSGISYATLVLLTIVMGLRFVFVATPWQRTYIAAFAGFVGLAGESVIIDSDHWRHYFLLLGVQWGLIGASWRYRSMRHVQRATERAEPLAPLRRPA
ncbi:MAG TPA: O-antigen ligase family protein [Xanthobacteraceae bacterium]|nr:O-antigen ligase family protein [Xanthobacteraceae bacterium]